MSNRKKRVNVKFYGPHSKEPIEERELNIIPKNCFQHSLFIAYTENGQKVIYSGLGFGYAVVYEELPPSL